MSWFENASDEFWDKVVNQVYDTADKYAERAVRLLLSRDNSPYEYISMQVSEMDAKETMSGGNCLAVVHGKVKKIKKVEHPDKYTCQYEVELVDNTVARGIGPCRFIDKLLSANLGSNDVSFACIYAVIYTTKHDNVTRIDLYLPLTEDDVMNIKKEEFITIGKQILVAKLLEEYAYKCDRKYTDELLERAEILRDKASSKYRSIIGKTRRANFMPDMFFSSAYILGLYDALNEMAPPDDECIAELKNKITDIMTKPLIGEKKYEFLDKLLPELRKLAYGGEVM